MKLVVLCFPVFMFVNGCSLFDGNKTVSEWSELKSASSAECEVFPHPKSVLRTRDLFIFEGEKLSFLADVVLRTGQRSTYFTPFQGSPKLQPETFMQHDFGSGSMIVGGAGISKGVYVALLQKQKGKAKLELRTLPDNIVRFSSEETSIKALSGKAYFTKHGVWLASKIDANQATEEDADVAVTFFRFGNKGKLIPRVFAKRSFPSSSQLLVDARNRNALITWSERNGKEQRFYMSELDPTKLEIEDPKPIEIQVSAELESWVATPFDGGMLIAFIDGDSLVGRSKLEISRVYWQKEYTKVVWNKEFALPNIHVSEPVWLTVGRGAKLMLPKWVDGESTVGIYTVNPDGTIRQKAAGIFPKGSRVMQGFRHVEKNDNYGVVRYRNKGAWQFEVCNLKDI